MNRKQHIALLLLAFWSVILGGPGFLLWREYRQQQLNQQLLTAVKRQDVRSALRALADGADANARDEPVSPPWENLWNMLRGRRPSQSFAYTPLLLLVWCNIGGSDNGIPSDPHPPEHVDLVKALLAHGANVNAADIREGPLLYALADNQKTATARLLIEHGAKVSDGKAKSLLYTAIDRYDDASIIELMLQRGADPNYENSDGTTPLAIAIYCRNRAAVAILLAHHSDPNITIWCPDFTGRGQPLEVAELLHATEIAKLLKGAGATKRPVPHWKRNGRNRKTANSK